MRSKIINYYENHRSHYSSYHNHKEVSAWAGLALFVFFSGIVNLVTIPSNYELLAVRAITVLVLIVTFLVYRYISTQLKMKDLGGAYTAASICLINDLISESITDDELSDYLIVEEAPDVEAQSRQVLPSKLLKKAEVLNTRGRGFQDTTRLMIYSILSLVSVLVICSKWSQFVS